MVAFTSTVGRMEVTFRLTVWEIFEHAYLARPYHLCKSPGRYRKVRETTLIAIYYQSRQLRILHVAHIEIL